MHRRLGRGKVLGVLLDPPSALVGDVVELEVALVVLRVSERASGRRQRWLEQRERRDER